MEGMQFFRSAHCTGRDDRVCLQTVNECLLIGIMGPDDRTSEQRVALPVRQQTAADLTCDKARQGGFDDLTRRVDLLNGITRFLLGKELQQQILKPLGDKIVC
jgi:hypothetical protein